MIAKLAIQLLKKSAYKSFYYKKKGDKRVQTIYFTNQLRLIKKIQSHKAIYC